MCFVFRGRFLRRFLWRRLGCWFRLVSFFEFSFFVGGFRGVFCGAFWCVYFKLFRFTNFSFLLPVCSAFLRPCLGQCLGQFVERYFARFAKRYLE